jgi:hypothetical protein
MDTEQLISHARARFDHEAAKRVLKEKYLGKLTFAHAGGLWKAGPELISTLQACSGDTAVILDLYETPVQINTQELLNKTQQHWQEQMNAWHIEFKSLSQNR